MSTSVAFYALHTPGNLSSTTIQHKKPASVISAGFVLEAKSLQPAPVLFSNLRRVTSYGFFYGFFSSDIFKKNA
jgi:hypothetical protein